ncbi:unnamed protein product [Orchesella dallaii]|uniref:Uncharacterized protein n=1 Tax=Orchesella dallaii TaxID=48710 RepID=A0ABP1QP68_9HEXA
MVDLGSNEGKACMVVAAKIPLAVCIGANERVVRKVVGCRVVAASISSVVDLDANKVVVSKMVGFNIPSVEDLE